MQEDLGRHGSNAASNPNGHQSEPTTPPEYSTIREHRESSSGFPTVLSRPNRYSTSSLTGPLAVGGLYNRPGRSASTLTSAQFGMLPSRFTREEKVVLRSGEGSRRGSDEEDDKELAVRQDPSSHRSSDRYVIPCFFKVVFQPRRLRYGDLVMRRSPSSCNAAETSAPKPSRRQSAALVELLRTATLAASFVL